MKTIQKKTNCKLTIAIVAVACKSRRAGSASAAGRGVECRRRQIRAQDGIRVAGKPCAGIDIGLTQRAGEPLRTGAGVALNAVVAGGAVLARVGRAVVNVGLALGARKPAAAGARISVYQIGARAAVLAR